MHWHELLTELTSTQTRQPKTRTLEWLMDTLRFTYKSRLYVQNKRNSEQWNIFVSVAFEAFINFTIACRQGSNWLLVHTCCPESARIASCDLQVDPPYLLTTANQRRFNVTASTERVNSDLLQFEIGWPPVSALIRMEKLAGKKNGNLISLTCEVNVYG